MSQNQLTIQLEPDEACVVMEKKFWDHMVHWYTIMANDTANPDEKANWSSVINQVERWVQGTYVDPKKAYVLPYSDELDDEDEY